MGIEPTRETLPSLGTWGNVRQDKSVTEVPGSSLSVLGLRPAMPRHWQPLNGCHLAVIHGAQS
jgi:hypothetical protein